MKMHFAIATQHVAKCEDYRTRSSRRLKQQELTHLNEQMALYNRNADNDGAKIRLEYIAKIREVIDDIEELTAEIKNY